MSETQDTKKHNFCNSADDWFDISDETSGLVKGTVLTAQMESGVPFKDTGKGGEFLITARGANLNQLVAAEIARLEAYLHLLKVQLATATDDRRKFDIVGKSITKANNLGINFDVNCVSH